MPRRPPNEVVLTGAHALAVAPGAAIAPAQWAATPARLARMDRLCALALVACDGALVDGALSPTAIEWHGERTAVVLGTAYGCHATNEEYYRGLQREGPSPRLFAYTLPSSPLGEISIHYGIRGPTTTLANGLTSGLDALAAGVALVADGRVERALVCAADVATPLLERIVGAGALRDAAAAVVVERAADAAARGATPRGRLFAAAALFQPGAAAAAVDAAIERATAQAEVARGALRRLELPRGALAAAPLIALVEWLSTTERDALALIAAGDEGGAAAAVVVAS